MYTTVLEVVRWRAGLREATVVSGFGRRAEWYRNAMAGGALEISVERLRFRPSVRVLGEAEASAVLAEYERRNHMVAPVVRAVLGRLSGRPYDGSEEACRRLAPELPLVAFSPADESRPVSRARNE